jgi:hypothetical protein
VIYADGFVRGIHARLAGTFAAMPPCLILEDEPNTDWPIAHFLAIEDSCARLTFDAESTPAVWVVAHELGHALHAYAGGSPRVELANDEVLAGYWRAAGYTASLADAIAVAEQVQNERGPIAAHPLYPVEHLADAFALVTFDGFGDAAFGYFGAPTEEGGRALTPERRLAVHEFFASLTPKEVIHVALTVEDRAEVLKILADYGTRLQDLQLTPMSKRIDELERRVINAGETLSQGRDIPGTP